MALTILVVDDDAAMREAVRRVLVRAGHSAATAASGDDALRALAASPADLVITDLRMPGLSGKDLVREVRRSSPRTQLLVMTAYGTVESAVECLRRGAYDYILKPFPPEVLESAVARAEAAISGPCSPGETEIIAAGPTLKRVLEFAAQAARSDATVLIEAESGTGKELLARYIHERSPRREGPFVALNCAAIPAELLESEIFGHEKGAFTGAARERAGQVTSAAGGTFLLDEVSEMSIPLQAKLLRLLQEREVRKVGSERSERVDVRFIASTNRRLADEVRAGRFREDLYYRLNVIPVRIPPLRERADEIPALARHFCARYARAWGFGGAITLSDAACALLAALPWYGNVRELENTIQRAVALGHDGTLGPDDLGLELARPAAVAPAEIPPGIPLEELERQAIGRTLDSVGGNRTRAARLLGISVRTLRNKLRSYREEAARAPSVPALAGSAHDRSELRS
ncbi:MAG: sigma-54-dependent Fis family transcriptional regulator [Acidobacteria bacterium]|nr:sigma-54-dependent Fis family transcriptional regulator [Acidobacteriota bacterium]